MLVSSDPGNSKPIQSQFMPKQTQYKANFNTKYAKQTQFAGYSNERNFNINKVLLK